MRKQRRVELKSVGNFVGKTVLVASANQFSLEELCMTQYILKNNFRSHIDHQTLWKILNRLPRYTYLNFAMQKGTIYYERDAVSVIMFNQNSGPKTDITACVISDVIMQKSVQCAAMLHCAILVTCACSLYM